MTREFRGGSLEDRELWDRLFLDVPVEWKLAPPSEAMQTCASWLEALDVRDRRGERVWRREHGSPYRMPMAGVAGAREIPGRRAGALMGTTAMRIWVLGLGALVASCGVGTENSSLPSDVPPASAGLRLSAEPLLQLGLEEGAPEEMFAGIAGALRLPDGRIVVGDGESRQLRVFDPYGAYLSGFGREGEGPGEVQSLWEVQRCSPAEIWVFGIPWRVNRFTLDGEFVDSLAPGAANGGPYRYACGGDGRILMAAWGQGFGAGTFVMTGAVSLVSAAGESLDLGEYPVSTRFGYEDGSGPHPYGPQVVLALSPSFGLIGTGESQELIRLSLPDGTMSKISVAAGAPSGELPADIEERYREWWLEGATSEAQRQAWAETIAGIEYPETAPPYAELRIDPEDMIWVRDFRHEWEAVDQWRVYSERGEFVGAIELPPRFRVTEIGTDHVVGTWSDELGTEFVRVYALTRAVVPRRPGAP